MFHLFLLIHDTSLFCLECSDDFTCTCIHKQTLCSCLLHCHSPCCPGQWQQNADLLCCNKCCVMQKSVFTMAVMTLRNCNMTAIERWKVTTVHKLLAFRSVHHNCLPTYSVTRVPCTMSSAACRPCPFLPASKILKIQQPFSGMHCLSVLMSIAITSYLQGLCMNAFPYFLVLTVVSTGTEDRDTFHVSLSVQAFFGATAAAQAGDYAVAFNRCSIKRC